MRSIATGERRVRARARVREPAGRAAATPSTPRCLNTDLSLLSLGAWEAQHVEHCDR